MTKLILSTGAGSKSKSNLELVNSLRDSFSAARQDYASHAPLINGFAEKAAGPDVPSTTWTERDGDTLYIPRIHWPAAGLREEPGEYETTVKLFFLPGASVHDRGAYAREALALVRKELGIHAVDLLIVSFPGMTFEGSCESEAERINAQQGNLDDEVATWRIFEELHRQGAARQLGIAEFGSEKLRAFLDRTDVHPAVNQINVQDCCNVPRPLKKLAEEQGIELNVHTDCTDILPHGTLRELLGHGTAHQGAGILAGPGEDDAGLEGDVSPQWVVRYTAFVRNRGVIENKGYFAGAQLK
ncbi:putative glutamate--cysteine ligase regulatory subunit [Escovopsis weberi]|uniref:GCS light chain n=1 Tax=Escovopsis weberi TaxID=150374 RepID=A0A0M8N7P4_ESCWE|nr:putative glutamate--cysteine ligase regulatory subunit [Escovopsis weberi]